MDIRNKVGELCIFIFLLGVAMVLGGTVYQMIVVTPEWAGDLPGSLATYFTPLRAERMGAFWRHPFIMSYGIFLVGAIVACWPNRGRRMWLFATLAIFIAILIWTLTYFIPQGVIPLFMNAGAGIEPSEITRRAEAWIFWDKVRLGVGALGFFCGLQALTRSPKAQNVST